LSRWGYTQKEVRALPDVRSPGRVDVRDLGQLLHQRRSAANKSLRQVMEEMDNALTASTLQRLEKGAVPEPKNVPVLARWLQIPVEMVTWPGDMGEGAPESVPDMVEVHLRADKNLTHDKALALSRMFRLLYDDLASGNEVPLANKPRRR
jgi:transcriptional regulator with XRE-family HTH domain